MLESFKQSSIATKYIKYLLSHTPLPLHPTIEHGQYMIEGVNYIYKDKVIRCTQSGRFSSIYGYDFGSDFLRVSNSLSVSPGDKKVMYIYDPGTSKAKFSPLVVTDRKVCEPYNVQGEFELVNNYSFGEHEVGLTQRFVSNSSHYDNLTHKFLGQYLRLIRNQFDLDLMSLYNCYNNEVCTTFSLDAFTSSVKDRTLKGKKVLLVPIKFNTTYTIAIDCDIPFLIKGVVYNNGLVVNSENNEYVSNLLEDKIVQINYSRFNKPFTVSLLNNSKYLQQFEDCLYMAIQVPYDLDSTLTVLEGDFLSCESRHICDIKALKEGKIMNIGDLLHSKPSLLCTNDKQQHPFSDKLISYLLRNTIDTREYIDDNVANVEKKIGYYPLYQGMWDAYLRYILFNRYMDMCDKRGLDKEDILGYVDRDIENAVRKGYINYAAVEV